MATSILAIILAAGRSTRMGRPKQLLPLKGIPLIEHSLRTLAASSVDAIVLVAGTLRDELEPICHPYRAQLVANPERDGDMASSVLAGMDVAVNATGILVHPGDCPCVQPETVNRLIELHALAPDRILIPVFQNRRGHPAIFPRGLLDGVGRGKNLRDVMKAHPDKIVNVPVDDPGILLDVDTPEDYDALLLSRGQEG